MPYIDPKIRESVDELLDDLSVYVTYYDEPVRHGIINYAVMRLIADTLPATRYHELQKIMGLFASMSAEYYRRVVAPYEDAACKKNGDVFLS